MMYLSILNRTNPVLLHAVPRFIGSRGSNLNTPKGSTPVKRLKITGLEGRKVI